MVRIVPLAMGNSEGMGKRSLTLAWGKRYAWGSGGDAALGSGTTSMVSAT